MNKDVERDTSNQEEFMSERASKEGKKRNGEEGVGGWSRASECRRGGGGSWEGGPMIARILTLTSLLIF